MQDWASYPTALRAAGERFAGVLIETRAAVDVLQQHDGPDTLHFVDPPYVTATRVMRKGGGYHHELTDDDHAELLAVLLELQGMVVLSGYSTELYDKTLAGWRRFETQSRASAGRGTVMRTEVVWLNPACSEALQRSRGGLFAEHAL
jgi:DNA adenine methylase